MDNRKYSGKWNLRRKSVNRAYRSKGCRTGDHGQYGQRFDFLQDLNFFLNAELTMANSSTQSELGTRITLTKWRRLARCWTHRLPSTDGSMKMWVPAQFVLMELNVSLTSKEGYRLTVKGRAETRLFSEMGDLLILTPEIIAILEMMLPWLFWQASTGRPPSSPSHCFGSG